MTDRSTATDTPKGPDFIIMGGMKCATSTLHEQLALQPGIFMTSLKEPNFFSNDEEFAKGMDYYHSLFAEAQADDLCGESSTHYTKLPTYPDTVKRLAAAFPHAKFIYVMRHPIDRLVSQYIHEWTQRIVDTEIDEAIDQFPEMVEYSLYTKQLQPYFEQFGRERVLPVFFERMLAQPQAELERVCQFIGYQGAPTWQELDAQNVSADRIRTSAWRDFLVEAPGLKQLRRWLIPKSLRTWVRSLWSMKKRPQLSNERLVDLQKIFDQDLEMLGAWLGIPLTCATFKATVKSQNSLHWVE
ncbi:sulfotransferase [Synechocystis salina LEGE 06155]|nr:sulfotransferase [Synechocystis salina LEGE 06155]